jgi:transcriptional regulator with XRE-family HTH domain
VKSGTRKPTTATKEAKRLREQAGEYLKNLRLKKELSQLELATTLGYAYYSFISQIESGTARVPPENLHAWAKALGVNVRPFSRALLRFYEPYYHAALFEAADEP